MIFRLTSIRPNAFRTLAANRHSLHLGISGTLLEDLPPGLFAPLTTLPQLSLDLRSNRFSSLSPAVLYSNTTDWEGMGTRVAAGELGHIAVKRSIITNDCA